MRIVIRLRLLLRYICPVTMFASFKEWQSLRLYNKKETIIMSTPANAFVGLETIYKFPYYLNQEDYTKKTGKAAPAYRADLPVKNWEDPAALLSTSRNMSYSILEMTDTNGYKVQVGEEIPIETMLMPRLQAASVNLMLAGTQPTDAFNGIVTPIPLNKLATNQKVVLQKFNIASVRDTNVSLPGAPAVPASNNDLQEQINYMTELLIAIGSKVGVKIVR